MRVRSKHQAESIALLRDIPPTLAPGPAVTVYWGLVIRAYLYIGNFRTMC
jgi:hypothetical protein